MRTARFGILFLLIVLSASVVHAQRKSRKTEENLIGEKQKVNLRNFVALLRPAFYNRDYKVLAAEMFKAKESESPEEDFDEEQAQQNIAVISRLFETAAADGIKFVVHSPASGSAV